MAGELVWIIDEEWPDYQVEEELLARELPDARIRHSTYDYEADLKAFGCRADIILAQIYVPLPAATIEKLECCKGIAVYGGGYDRVDIAAARQKGISVTRRREMGDDIEGACGQLRRRYIQDNNLNTEN